MARLIVGHRASARFNDIQPAIRHSTDNLPDLKKDHGLTQVLGMLRCA